MVQRIESGETGRGIPDLFLVHPAGIMCWCELKRVAQPVGYTKRIIPWHPGQQAWMHCLAEKCGRGSIFTLVAFPDLIEGYYHDILYQDNAVSYPTHWCTSIGAVPDLCKATIGG